MRSNSITLLESFSHINTIASPARARAHTHINTRATFHCHKLVFLHNYTLSDTSRHVKKKDKKKYNNNNTSLFINNIPPSIQSAVNSPLPKQSYNTNIKQYR